MSYAKLIIGLGNPGLFYRNSRHNIGFSVVSALAKSRKAGFKKEKGIPALSGRVKIDNQDLILAMPLTFMNLSGLAAGALLKKYKIDLSDLLIVCDDLDLEFARLKIRPAGSSAGHRGVQSIIETLGSDAFSRLRIGIGRPVKAGCPSDYVLSLFNKKEREDLKEVIKEAADCCLAWAREGIAHTMNTYNKRSGNG